jgi:hypothetical protein
MMDLYGAGFDCEPYSALWAKVEPAKARETWAETVACDDFVQGTYISQTPIKTM